MTVTGGIKIADHYFLGGPVVKDLSSNTGDMDLIPGWGLKIPHATGQLNLCATTAEHTCLAREPVRCNWRCLHTAAKTQHSQ